MVKDHHSGKFSKPPLTPRLLRFTIYPEAPNFPRSTSARQCPSPLSKESRAFAGVRAGSLSGRGQGTDKRHRAKRYVVKQGLLSVRSGDPLSRAHGTDSRYESVPISVCGGIRKCTV